MKRTVLLLFALISVLLLNRPSWATHAVVSAGTTQVGPLVTYSALTLPAKVWSFDIQAEFVDFDGFSKSELRGFAEKGEDVHSVSSLFNVSLGIGYGITDNLTLGIRMPYVAREDIKEAHGDEPDEVHEHGDARGFGDLTLLGRFRFLNLKEDRFSSTLLVGLKVPTGKTNDRDDEGETFDAEFQPGSGSWDPMVGLALTKGFDRFSFDANIMYTLVTEGTQDTDLGDVFSYNAALSYRALLTPVAIDLMVEANGIWRAKQKAHGEKDDNSGGNLIFISPGVRLLWKNNLSAYLSLGIPIVDDPNGIQNDTNYRVFGGLGFSF